MTLKDECGKTIKKGQIVHILMNGMAKMRVVEIHEGQIEGGPPAHIVLQLVMGVIPVDPDGICAVYIVDRIMDKLISEVVS